MFARASTAKSRLSNFCISGMNRRLLLGERVLDSSRLLGPVLVSVATWPSMSKRIGRYLVEILMHASWSGVDVL